MNNKKQEPKTDIVSLVMIGGILVGVAIGYA
ncbi:hypothetical protein LCGC14_3031320, partial [marine sediment metagenome]